MKKSHDANFHNVENVEKKFLLTTIKKKTLCLWSFIALFIVYLVLFIFETSFYFKIVMFIFVIFCNFVICFVHFIVFYVAI